MQCDDLLRLAHAIAPELRQQPLYILDAKAPGLPPSTGCLLGYAMPAETDFLRDVVPNWNGPGPLIALDFARIAADGASVEQTLVHEVAHLLPFQPSLDLPDSVSPQLLARQVNWLASAGELKGTEPQPAPGTDRYHDWRFLRRALHLFVRAAALGHDIPLSGLFRDWWQSWEVWYLTPLLSEAIRMRDATFAEIEATTPPAKFMEVWNRNVELCT